MSDGGRLAGFAAVLAVALGAGYGVGALVGPSEPAPDVTVVETGDEMTAEHD